MAGLNISPYQTYNQTHNYSSLFAGINKASSDNGWDLSGLADYASIKNGSYGKLVRSSYAKTNAASSDSNLNAKSTITSAEDRRKAREAAQNGATSGTSTAGSSELTGAAARRAAREAKANGTSTTTQEENAVKSAETVSTASQTDSAKATYTSNAVTSPSMSELMASTFDTNV